MLVFEERGKPEYQEKNLSEQRREQTTNSTNVWRRHRYLSPGQIGGRRVLARLRHHCSLSKTFTEGLAAVRKLPFYNLTYSHLSQYMNTYLQQKTHLFAQAKLGVVSIQR